MSQEYPCDVTSGERIALENLTISLGASSFFRGLFYFELSVLKKLMRIFREKNRSEGKEIMSETYNLGQEMSCQ